MPSWLTSVNICDLWSTVDNQLQIAFSADTWHQSWSILKCNSVLLGARCNLRFLHKQQLEMGGLLKRLKPGSQAKPREPFGQDFPVKPCETSKRPVCVTSKCHEWCHVCRWGVVSVTWLPGPHGKSWSVRGRWRWNDCCSVRSSGLCNVSPATATQHALCVFVTDALWSRYPMLSH